MKPLLLVLLLSALPSSAQTAAAPPADQQPSPEQGASKSSVLKVQHGEEAIKERDRYDRSGYWHPFRRMPAFFLMDQKKIWTSPFRTSRKDAKWWALWGGATVGLIAADRYIERSAPTNDTLVSVGNGASHLGQAYTLLPVAAGMYFFGTDLGKDHFREAGLLSFETIADVTVLQVALKAALGRERPTEGRGNGAFEQSPHRWNSSFPSGHTITTFAMASVIAHEYPQHWWIKALIYGYGAGVAAARLASRRHFPGDVVGGGAMGWFIGDYVYGKRHNPDLDKKSTVRVVLSHIQIGGGVN